jgi:hypothetical protein
LQAIRTEATMDALMTVGIAAAFAGLLVLVGWSVRRLWRAVMREDRPVLMQRMLERQGLSLDRLRYSTGLEQAAAAARRCAVCRDRESCLAWLDADGKTEFAGFCPNADFIARLRAEAAA